MNNAGLQKKDPLDIITAEMVQRACVEQAGLTASGKEAVAESAESARSHGRALALTVSINLSASP